MKVLVSPEFLSLQTPVMLEAQHGLFHLPFADDARGVKQDAATHQPSDQVSVIRRFTLDLADLGRQARVFRLGQHADGRAAVKC